MDNEPRPALIRTCQDHEGRTIKIYDARYAIGALRQLARPSPLWLATGDE
jgi:hypothetical protein